ncbi:hypothetical protein [Neiella marina]|uniref:hypothetical protein n=1 Tax=Neiella marina TaxID=508461 RepID=UPI00166A6938|nr:hypothetical protein [Neiella marina]
MDKISLPDTCLSCVHYQQQGLKHDELAKRLDWLGYPIPAKRQRFGYCQKSEANVFWDERCSRHSSDPLINTHACPVRPKPLETRQDVLF